MGFAGEIFTLLTAKVIPTQSESAVGMPSVLERAVTLALWPILWSLVVVVCSYSSPEVISPMLFRERVDRRV